MTSENVLRSIRTRRMFLVFAARRSGQHAVIWWLRSLFRAPHERINNCSLPYSTQTSPPRFAVADGPGSFRALFLNFEDKVPAELRRFADEGTPPVKGIASEDTTYVLILRDPFNNLASKRQANPERTPADLRREVELWKSHAREYLRETTHLPSAITVNYNAWFADSAYRRRLAAALRTDYSADSSRAAAALQDVPIVGQSQFDGRRYHRSAQRMDVFNRWRRRLADPLYVRVFRDRELLTLSGRIFQVEGVQELVDLAGKRIVTTGGRE